MQKGHVSAVGGFLSSESSINTTPNDEHKSNGKRVFDYNRTEPRRYNAKSGIPLPTD